jgi:hypothetical protein
MIGTVESEVRVDDEADVAVQPPDEGAIVSWADDEAD